MTWPEYLAGCCRLNGNLTRITFQEADYILALLLGHPDKWTSATELIERIWDNPEKQPIGASRQLAVTMVALRRRGVIILNEHGWGYRIPREARGRELQLKAA